jgi:Fic-DOC domain mobile mystery protein B
VTDPLFDGDDDASTPLTPEERDALIPSYIRQRAELNEVEQLGIDNASAWAFARKRDVLSEDFLRGLHGRMFGGVWRWAGEFRTTARNIGVAPWEIAVQVRQLLDDVRYWIEHQTYPPDEIAVRFHHRLVFIHPFPNGNGRLTRMTADLLAVRLGRDRFSWGSGNLVAADDLRSRYIAALKAADGNDIGPLLEFAQS